jgi:dihydropteroate synthase
LRGSTQLLGQRTWLMGVINVTPDSFYEGSRTPDAGRAAARGLELAAQGADILDIGGESTRPGSDPVPAEEEKRRVVPVIKSLRRQADVFLSVDTSKRDVAQAAVEAGADIVNDISALRFDAGLLKWVASSGAAVVLMHMKGTPKTMQAQPRYDDVLAEVRAFLAERKAAALAAGLAADRIILDPGIGFGKRPEDNLTLLNRLSSLSELDCPLLVGPSRKSFLGAVLGLPAEERLEGTLAAAVLSVARGAHILRIHDVEAVRRAVRTAEAVLAEQPNPAPPGKNEARLAG